MSFDANEVINGKYGFLYDEDGRQLTTTQDFEGVVDLNKEEIEQAGEFMSGHKVMGGSGSGSMTYLKITSALVKKIAEDPTAKFNYIGKLADPTAKGEEAVLYKRLSFDQIPLQNYSIGELVEVELDFTFEGWRYQDDIAE